MTVESMSRAPGGDRADLREVLVYVAGPISKGDVGGNVRRAFAAACELMAAGLTPVVPHGSCFWGAAVTPDGAFRPEVSHGPFTHADWLAVCLPVVRRCDALVRLPGESSGADMEAAEARSRGIPVYPGVAELLADLPSLTNRPGAPGEETA